MQTRDRAFAAIMGALVILVIPVAASADTTRNWTHNGAPLASNAELTLHGGFNFTSSAGGVACNVTSSITLEPGSTGKVTSFQPSATNTCTYSGNLDNLCGTVDSHAATGLPWTVHGTRIGKGEYKMVVTSFHADFGGTGIFCPDVTVKGTKTLIITQNPINTIHNHGTLASNLGTEVTAGGTMHVTPASTYGLEA